MFRCVDPVRKVQSVCINGCFKILTLMISENSFDTHNSCQNYLGVNIVLRFFQRVLYINTNVITGYIRHTDTMEFRKVQGLQSRLNAQKESYENVLHFRMQSRASNH